MSEEKKIESLQKDGQIFQPDTSMQAQAWIQNMEAYEAANEKALNDPEVRGDLEANGQPVVAERGPKVERLLRDDIAYWKTVARDAKLKVD